MIMCQKCKVKESTGFLVLLCDECYDEFENTPDSEKVAYLDPSVVYQKYGGMMPDDVKSVNVSFDESGVHVKIKERNEETTSNKAG